MPGFSLIKISLGLCCWHCHQAVRVLQNFPGPRDGTSIPLERPGSLLTSTGTLQAGLVMLTWVLNPDFLCAAARLAKVAVTWPGVTCDLRPAVPASAWLCPRTRQSFLPVLGIRAKSSPCPSSLAQPRSLAWVQQLCHPAGLGSGENLGESLLVAQHTQRWKCSLYISLGLLFAVRSWRRIRAIAPCMGSRKAAAGCESPAGEEQEPGPLLVSHQRHRDPARTAGLGSGVHVVNNGI